MTEKYLQRIVVWKKKPDWGNTITGIILVCVCLFFIIFAAIAKDMDNETSVLITFGATIFGTICAASIAEYWGEGRRVLYKEVKR